MKKTIILTLLSSPSLLTLPLVAQDFWFSGIQKVDLSSEFLHSNDISVAAYQFLYSGKEGPWTIDLGLGLNDYRIDYSPVLFGADVTLDEQTWQGNIAATRNFGKSHSLGLRLRGYEGFADHRSIWISQFYQQFFGSFPAYTEPDPRGYAFGTTYSFNQLPNYGKLELNIDYGRDTIAPGWSFDGALGRPVSDRDELTTWSVGLRSEQPINPWLKSETFLSAREISEREVRYGIRQSLGAVSGPVAFRLTAGYTEEAPTFDALFASAQIEWNFLPEWTLITGYRRYSDSGEIENSGFNAQAPALESAEIFAGILWDHGDLAISSSIGFLTADYAQLSDDNRFFGNLYRDRDWLTLRFAASYQF